MPRSSKVPLLRACVRLCRDSTWARLIRHNPSQTDPLSLSLPCHKCFGSKCVMQKGNSWCGLSTFVSACLKRWYTTEKVHSFMYWFFLLQRNLVISRLFTKKPPKFPKFPSQTFVDQRHRQPLYILQSLSHLRGWGVNQPWHNFFVSYVSYVYIFQIKHSKTSQKTSLFHQNSPKIHLECKELQRSMKYATTGPFSMALQSLQRMPVMMEHHLKIVAPENSFEESLTSISYPTSECLKDGME